MASQPNISQVRRTANPSASASAIVEDREKEKEKEEEELKEDDGVFNPLQDIVASVKATAISAKRLVTEIADSPNNVAYVCQEAEKTAFLMLMGIVELEKKEKKDDEAAVLRMKNIAKAAEDLYKSVLKLTEVATDLANSTGVEDEEAQTNLQRVQLSVSERVNQVLELLSVQHENSMVATTEEDSIKPPIQSEAEAKGLDMTDIRQKKGLAYIFSLSKRCRLCTLCPFIFPSIPFFGVLFDFS